MGFVVNISVAVVEGSATVEYADVPSSLEHVHALSAGHGGVPSTAHAGIASAVNVGCFL